jgi:RNA polymerase sigma-70 factor (ECF subfamily)
MSTRAVDSSIELPPLLALETARRAEAASIEADVMTLFDGFRDPLLRYVCAFGLTVGDAEDVVQDVFVALFRHLLGRGDRTNLRGWLFRVAHNLALKRLALRRREQERFRAGEQAAQLVLDPGRDPEEQLSTSERRRKAAAVLNALPERDRHCVRLRGHGLRYREIAQVLGISLGAVAKSLTRAIARLQRAAGEREA